MSTTRSTRKCGICRQSGHNSRTCTESAERTGQLDTNMQVSETSQPTSPPAASSDLGRLRIGRSKVLVGLLPSQASSVMVKYQPDIQVSCVIPPQDFEVSYSARSLSKKFIEVTTPTLILNVQYGDVPTMRTMKSSKTFTLWAIDTNRTHKIYAKAYTFANVWTDGRICFGSLKPSSLRQAYNQYWTSSFNNDLLRDKHECNNKAHSYAYHNGHHCDSSFKNHTCSCSRTTFHKHRGCGCTTVANSKKCKAKCGNRFADTCDCCVAIKARQEAARLENPGITDKELDKLVKVAGGTAYPGCGCTYRHKRGCLCGKNRCECECLCPCCTETCDHSVCNCRCCKNTCQCYCNCSVSQKLQQHIETYHSDILPKKKWQDQTNTFCGTKFWASPEGSTGILVASDQQLLNQIPRKYWRKDRHNQALIIAAAYHKGDHWLFKSGGFTFELDESYIIAR